MIKTHLLSLLAGSILSASAFGQAYIGNGNFDTWKDLGGKPPQGTPVYWGGSTPIQAPALSDEAGFSALLRGGSMLYQQLNDARSFPDSFAVSQTVVVLSQSGWQQPFWITLEETGAGGSYEGRHGWIQLRIAGSGSQLSIQVNDGSNSGEKWKTIADKAIEISEYEEESNSFPVKNAYVITIERRVGESSYSVSYGKVGESLTTVSGVKHFVEPTNGSGRLAFISYGGVGSESHHWGAVGSVVIKGESQ